jgi:hypothetical protein
VVRCVVRMALTVTSSSDCQDLQRPELPASATVCLELCTAVEDQRPQADLVAAAHQAKEEGVQRGRERKGRGTTCRRAEQWFCRHNHRRGRTTEESLPLRVF